MSKFRVYITVENPSIKLGNKFLDYLQQHCTDLLYELNYHDC